MDDVITILLIVLWVGYSFYKASKKRQAARAAQQAKAEAGQNARPPQQSPQKPVGRTIEQMLEELLNEKRVEEKYEEEALDEEAYLEEEAQISPLQPIESTFSYDAEYARTSAPANIVIETLESTSDSRRVVMADKPLEILRTDGTHLNFEWLYEVDGLIDLRKAVVYSEIINRPYQ